MPAISVHFLSGASLRICLIKINYDFQVDMRTWSELEGECEVGLYYPVCTAIKNVSEPAEFWIYDEQVELSTSLLSSLGDTIALNILVDRMMNRIRGDEEPSSPTEKSVGHTLQAGKYESHDQTLLPKGSLSNRFLCKEQPGNIVEIHTNEVLLFYGEETR